MLQMVLHGLQTSSLTEQEAAEGFCGLGFQSKDQWPMWLSVEGRVLQGCCDAELKWQIHSLS